MAKHQFGLVGKNISYSFSKAHFTKKFEDLNLLDYSYENIDFQDISELPNFLRNNPNLKGFNVTIPFKESIIPYLNKLSKEAAKIGAVNTIRFTKKGKLKGYNTDYYGFQKALKPLLLPHHKKALLLGTGGASKAVAHALNQMGIAASYVSRTSLENNIRYSQITATTFVEYQIIINCTPIGTSPNINECPEIPYHYLTSNHIAFDLIYNPPETLFLQKAKQQGAITKNGLEMLVFQAEKASKIWGI
ncbi:MAG: shikimate dehydrogenase [Flavobacteriaceae bacterium]|nr:shikimate dehydrogenase [Flavobacteriaceae bacterium]